MANQISSAHIPVYGNYHGYYWKRPSVHDPRLSLLPSDLFEGARVLDVGCNEGWVTCEIAQSWGASKVIGVDIDDFLIQGAWKRRRTVWSLRMPREIPSKGPRISENFKPESNNMTDSSHYFPISCEHEFGPLPVPPWQIYGRHAFPHNTSFRTADWVSTEIPEDKEHYDVVIAFSLSKWIHLNGGDVGVKTFFQRVFDVLNPGGTFVLEPQPWESYSKSKRIDERLKENAKKIQLRPEDFADVLSSIGFGPVRNLGKAGQGGFERPLQIFKKLGYSQSVVNDPLIMPDLKL